MNQKVILRRARRRDIEAITGIINSSGWTEQPITEVEAAGMLLEKGVLLAVSRQGAALIGWQTENLVNCANDFFVYPAREAETLGPHLLEGVEAAAKELECEVSAILISPKGRSALEPVLQKCGYESKSLSDLDRIWAEVLTPFLPEEHTEIWLKRLRTDRVTMPI